jgi:hypothetical protein
VVVTAAEAGKFDARHSLGEDVAVACPLTSMAKVRRYHLGRVTEVFVGNGLRGENYVDVVVQLNEHEHCVQFRAGKLRVPWEEVFDAGSAWQFRRDLDTVPIERRAMELGSPASVSNPSIPGRILAVSDLRHGDVIDHDGWATPYVWLDVDDTVERMIGWMIHDRADVKLVYRRG